MIGGFRLRTFAALPKDQDSVLSTYMVTHNHPQLQLKEILCLFLNSVGTRHTFSSWTYMQAKSNIHKIEQINLK